MKTMDVKADGIERAKCIWNIGGSMSVLWMDTAVR
jgi:hypothetical protein